MLAQTDDQPKCLVQWQGKAILDWQLEALRDVGIRDIAIVTGYRREKLKSHKLYEFINHKWAESSMVESLLCADEWFSTSPCLALYSDIVYSPKALEPIVQPLDTLGVASYSKWFELWSMRFNDVFSDTESFKVDRQGLVMQIGSKTNRLEDIQGQFMGMLQFQPPSWGRFKRAIERLVIDRTPISDLTELLGHIVSMNWMPLQSVTIDGTWAEFDSESDLIAAEAFAVRFRSEFDVS